MAQIHDRQPVILHPAELMQAYAVSPSVNAVKNQGPQLVQPAEQMTLL